ncbi:MAG: CheR family methyltransferase [Gemmatimonadaceae bacterium]
MIAPEDFRFLQEMLRAQSGLMLAAGKEYLVESRLPPVVAAHGLANLPALVRELRAGNVAVAKAVCDAMTTGETLFFRDETPFAAFRETLLPEAVARACMERRPLRVWSAACSTGQEVYSLAIIAEEERRRLAGTSIEFLATDYSTATLARAARGQYSKFEAQRGLPIQLLLKYFTPEGDGFAVRAELRRGMRFREHNLLAPCAHLGQFDVIFLRNVLIYFDLVTKKAVLERLARQLVPGGALVLGGTENTLGITDALTRRADCGASVYTHPGTPGVGAPGTPPPTGSRSRDSDRPLREETMPDGVECARTAEPQCHR